MHLKYFIGALKTHKGKVIGVEHKEQDYYVVKIKVESGVTWNAGEFAQFRLQNKKIRGKKYRMFSVASLPSEDYILLGFRTGRKLSNYKRFLIEEGVGKDIKIRGPFGPFRLRADKRPIVLYASGVGITPILGILKDIEHHFGRKITVVYASSSYYLFKEEIDKIVKENHHINITYTKDRSQTEIALLALVEKLGNEAYYYSSGAPKVIKSVKKLLRRNGIKKKNLINDSFHGY